MEAKLWRARRSRIERVHMWRPRRACYGELVQWDSSEHSWLEGRGEKLYLISMMDDATSQLTARLRHDSTEENLEQLRRGTFYFALTPQKKQIGSHCGHLSIFKADHEMVGNIELFPNWVTSGWDSE